MTWRRRTGRPPASPPSQAVSSSSRGRSCGSVDSWMWRHCDPGPRRHAGLGRRRVVVRVHVAPLALVAGMGAFVVPDVALSRAAKARVRAADAEVPQFLDLLAAASAGGLAAPAAIARAIAGLRGPLASELEGAVAAVGVGGR